MAGEGGKVDPKVAEELLKATQAVKSAAVETTNAFQEQLRIITQMRDVMSQLADSTKDIGGESQQGLLNPDKWQEVTKRIEKARTEGKSASDTMTKLGKVMKSDLTKGALTAAGALTGLGQGFRNLLAVAKTVGGIFGKITGAAFSLGKSLISIPFKISKVLQGMAAQGGGSNEIAQALEEIRDQYGSLKSDASQAIIQTSNNMMTMNQTGIDSYRIFGNTAERLKLVTELANGMGAAFGSFQDEIAANGTAIISYQKGLGLTNEQMGTLASNAMRMGKGIAQVQNEMTKQALGMSKAFGVNAKVISKDMGKAMADLAHFGHLSTKEMAVAATFANKLGVSVDKLTSVMDATSTFDQAAEGMSKLNEQFGTNIDATAIMSAQNPAEKVEMLRKEFAKTGKSIEGMSYQERMLIKQSSGLSDEMLNAALSAKNAGVSLDEIQRQGSKNEKKTLSQADAMHELADSIKRLTPSGDAGTGSIFDRFIEGFGRGIMGSKEFIKLMNNIREIFRIAMREGVKLGRTFAELFPGVQDVLKGLQEVFDPRRFKKMFDGINTTFRNFAKGGSQDVGKLMDDLQANFLDFFDSGKGPGKKVLAGFGKFFEAIGIIFGKLSEWLVKKMADGIVAITKFLKNPVLDTPSAPGATALMKSFSGVIDAFKTKLLPALEELGSFLWDKFVKFFKEKIVGSTTGKVAIGAAIAAVLVPTIANAFGGAAAGNVLKKAGGSFMGKAAGSIKDAMGGARGAEATAEASGATGAVGAAKKASEVVSNVVPEKAVIEKLKVASETKIDWTGLAKFMAAFAIFLGVAGLAFFGAVKAVSKSGISLKEIGMTEVFLLAMMPPIAAAGLLVLEAQKVGNVITSGMKETITGLAAMGAVLVALGTAGALFGWLIKKVGASDMLAGADILNTMSNVFMKTGVIIAEAALIGAGIIATAGIGGVAIATGMATMSAAVMAMAGTAVSIMRSLSKIEGDPAAIKQKVEAFSSIMAAISGMVGGLGSILKELNAGFIDTLFGDSTTKKVDKMKDFVKVLLNGEDGKGGIQGVIDSIMLGISGGLMGLGDTQLKALPVVAGLFKTVVDLVGAVSAATKGGNVEIKDNKGTINIINQMPSITDIISKLSEAGPQLFNKMIELTSAIPADAAKGPKFTDKIAVIGSVFDVFSKITGIISSASKIEYQQGEGPIQAIGRNMDFIRNVVQVLAGESLGSGPKYASLNDVTALMNKLQIDNSITTKADQIVKVTENITKVAESISRVPSKIEDIQAAFGKLSGNMDTVSTEGIAKNISAVKDMVAKVQEMDSALSKLPAIDMKAKLTALSKGMGLGSSGAYTVQSKDVVININMTVTMNAGEVERVIIGRSESIIRDRINFAIDKGGKADTKAKEALVKPNVEGNAGFYGRGIANSGG